jgi:signal transduction histidine kinase
MRRWPRGLRGRLVLAFVGTSAFTLAVVAAVTLSPLQNQLRELSVDNLRDAVLASRPEFETALTADEQGSRLGAVSDAAFDFRQQVDARVLVDSDEDDDALPDFFYDSEYTPADTGDATLAALASLREARTVINVDGDQVTVAAPLFQVLGGVLVAQRRLTEVTTTVEQVGRALLVAALVGLLATILVAIGLSSTLLRRLARLRVAALRITADGPDAPAPRDRGRDEVGDLARALARMQEELRRQEAARRSFVATASHELRTPLTMRKGPMELLEEDLHDGRVDVADAQLQVSIARGELRRLSTLASELLDLSRLDADVQLRSEPVELGEIGRAVAAEFALQARDAEVELDVQPAADGCWGRGDPDAAARVVRILLDNALRYGPAGGKVTVTTCTQDARATIEVADDGPGIPAEEHEYIFERFHRGRSAGPEGGFGLGLAIGRELAQRMGGALALADGPQEGGARFVLALPVAGAGAETSRAQARALT